MGITKRVGNAGASPANCLRRRIWPAFRRLVLSGCGGRGSVTVHAVVSKMTAMKRSLGFGTVTILVASFFLAPTTLAQDEDDQYSALSFVVVRDYNGKPVKNASVIMHPVNKKGKQQRSGFQLKTNSEGKTNFDGVPYGMLRVQVLAQGFQTYGEDYDVNKPQMEITIKLKRPQGQYSVYEDHPEAKKDEQKPPEQKPEEKEAQQKPQ